MSAAPDTSTTSTTRATRAPGSSARSAAAPTVDPTPAKAPVALPATVVTGALLALLLLGVAVVLVRDALVAAGLVTGSPWVTWVADKAQVLSASSPWMVWAGPVAVVLGLVLVVAALKPRKRTHWALEEQGVHIGRRDAARLAANAAHEASSVVDARADAGRRRVTVTARTVATDTAGVTQQVDGAIASRLAPLRPTPRVRTRIVTTTSKED